MSCFPFPALKALGKLDFIFSPAEIEFQAPLPFQVCGSGVRQVSRAGCVGSCEARGRGGGPACARALLGHLGLLLAPTLPCTGPCLSSRDCWAHWSHTLVAGCCRNPVTSRCSRTFSRGQGSGLAPQPSHKLCAG